MTSAVHLLTSAASCPDVILRTAVSSVASCVRYPRQPFIHYSSHIHGCAKNEEQLGHSVSKRCQIFHETIKCRAIFSEHLLEVYSRENFENRSSFGEAIGKTIWFMVAIARPAIAKGLTHPNHNTNPNPTNYNLNSTTPNC